MKKYFPLLAVLALTVACDHVDRPKNPQANQTLPNTETNVTPMDQSENPADLEVTQKIRRAAMANNSLSMNAKNIKIITRKGVVTLRGIVNEDDKEAILIIVRGVPGVASVDDQLEVIPNNP